MDRLLKLLRLDARFLRYLVVGGFNTVLDLCLYFIFSDVLSIYPVVASLLSTGLTMCVSFLLNHHFVFRSNKNKRQTVPQFVAATLFNVWGVQSLVIYLVLSSLKGLHAFSRHHWTLTLLPKLCGVAVSFVLNFLMYRYIFHEKPSEVEEPVVL